MEEMEEMEKKESSALMRGPWRSFDGKKESIDRCFPPKAPVWSDSMCSRRLNERQTYRDNSFGDTKDASVSNKTSLPLSMVCFADDLLMILADPGSTLGAHSGRDAFG